MIIAHGVFAPICGQLVDKFSLKNLLSFGAIIFVIAGFCSSLNEGMLGICTKFKYHNSPIHIIPTTT